MNRRTLLVAVAATSVACLVALLAFVVGTIARVAGGTRVPISGVATLVVVVTMFLLAWRASQPARTNATAAAFTFALVPVLAIGTCWALWQPLATSHVRCGTGDIGIPLGVMLAIFVSCTVALPFAWVAASHTRGRVAFVAGVALTLVLGMSAVAALRSLRHPEPDAYLAIFERATLEPGGVDAEKDKGEAYGMAAGCVLHVVDDVRLYTSDSCPRFGVYRHAPSGTTLITDVDDPAKIELIVHRDFHQRSGDLGVDELRGSLGAPRGWVLGGVIGFLFAVAALAFAFRNLRRARTLPPIISAAHEGGGWVRIDDVPRFVPALMAASPGAVAIIAPTSRAATYRNDGAAAEYEVARETSDALRARAVSWAWTAAAIATCSAVPLWVARSFGLL